MWLESVQAYNILFATIDNVSSALLKKNNWVDNTSFFLSNKKKKEKAKHSGLTYKPTCARPLFNLSGHVEPSKLKCLTLLKTHLLFILIFIKLIIIK